MRKSFGPCGCECESQGPTLKPDLEEAGKEGYIGGAHFADCAIEQRGKTLSALSDESNVAKTTTVKRCGTDTVYVCYLLSWCQECVKVELGRDIYIEA